MLKNKYGFTIDNMMDNIVLLTDGYKFGHHLQRPSGTELISSYFESRGSVLRSDGTKMFNGTVFFGLRYILKRFLEGQVVTHTDVTNAKLFVDDTLGPGIFNEDGWRHIVNEFGGRLPVIIRAVPEGTFVPLGNIMMDIENIGGEKTNWLPNYLETILTHVWYTSVVATNSMEIKRIQLDFHKRTSDSSVEGVDFQTNDFGFRGVTCSEQAGLGGMAHLTSFKGSDTTLGSVFAIAVYNADSMPGFTIPASEHSTATPFGREGEVEYLRNMLTKFPTGLVATVGDSYDIINFVTNTAGTTLHDLIMNREGRWICRPDSGDPIVTTEKLILALWDKFGGEVNSKGYKVLDTHVRMIQGDGVDRDMVASILTNFEKLGFSSENIAFGSGGGLLQMFNRDTLKNAFKCSYIKMADGTEVDVRKSPMEFNSNGNYVQSFKQSKAGLMGLIKDENGNLKTVPRSEAGSADMLETVFSCGHLSWVDNSFEAIRNRINTHLNTK